MTLQQHLQTKLSLIFFQTLNFNLKRINEKW